MFVLSKLKSSLRHSLQATMVRLLTHSLDIYNLACTGL